MDAIQIESENRSVDYLWGEFIAQTRLAEHLCPFSCHIRSSGRMSSLYRSHSQILDDFLYYNQCSKDPSAFLSAFLMVHDNWPDKSRFLWCSVGYLGHITERSDISVSVLLDLVGHTIFRGRSNLWFVSMTAPGRMRHPCDFLQVYQYSGKDDSRIIFLLNLTLEVAYFPRTLELELLFVVSHVGTQKEFFCKTSGVFSHLAYRMLPSYHKQQNNAKVISTCVSENI